MTNEDGVKPQTLEQAYALIDFMFDREKELIDRIAQLEVSK